MGVSEAEPEVSNGVGPFWTEKLYRPSGGQDHLGLGSVSSDRILRTLAPGINVLTVHPRYWSFYSFVLDEFWQRRLARTRRSFAGFYRPCESIYAVAAHLCDRPEHEMHGPMRGVVGTDKARPYAAQARDGLAERGGDALAGWGGYVERDADLRQRRDQQAGRGNGCAVVQAVPAQVAVDILVHRVELGRRQGLLRPPGPACSPRRPARAAALRANKVAGAKLPFEFVSQIPPHVHPGAPRPELAVGVNLPRARSPELATLCRGRIAGSADSASSLRLRLVSWTR